MSAPKLLIVTQKVDVKDSNLGFFVRWIEEFARRCGQVAVIAPEARPDAKKYLPTAVSFYSLGKERGASRLARLFRYERLLLKILPQVDGVFFHMCPEYVLGAHLFPRILGKKTLLWYVHKRVHARLRLSALLVDRIFTASVESCRLRSKKVEAVGHGIDMGFWSGPRREGTGLRLVTSGRIAPAKDLRTLIRGFLELRKRFPEAELSVIGEPLSGEDLCYDAQLRREFSSAPVRFLGGLPQSALPRLYEDATVFVHASRTGSMDKAVLEALAAGLPVFTSSEAFSEEMGVRKFKEGDAAELARQIESAYRSGALGYNEKGRIYVERNHSLPELIQKIVGFYES